MRHAIELLAIALLTLAFTAPEASAQTLGEVTAATGIHSTLSRQGVNSSTSALDTVKRNLAKSTKPRDYDFESGSGMKSGSRPASKQLAGKNKMALRSGASASSRGSWVSGGSAGKGNSSTAWAKGATGWDAGSAGWATGGNGWDAGGGGSASHRPRS